MTLLSTFCYDNRSLCCDSRLLCCDTPKGHRDVRHFDKKFCYDIPTGHSVDILTGFNMTLRTFKSMTFDM